MHGAQILVYRYSGWDLFATKPPTAPHRIYRFSPSNMFCTAPSQEVEMIYSDTKQKAGQRVHCTVLKGLYLFEMASPPCSHPTLR